MTAAAHRSSAPESAADAIARAGGPVPLLRNAQARPTIFPVAPEFSNWRSEQQAWHESVALLDQSHHMTDLFISGPDALRLLSDTGVNSFERFRKDRAKQFIAVNHEGRLIGDAILFPLGEGRFDLVGWFMVLDWVQFIGETGDYDVAFERDPNSLMRGGGDPVLYRYEVQGPRALELMERATGEPVPETRFFGLCSFTIAGHEVRALRHGMAGQPGFELFGPWDEGDAVRAALLEAGDGLDLVLVGARAYSSSNLESAWVPSPLPAIFTGKGMEDYLRWLPARRVGSLAGSLDSDDIEDYYVTPYDLGYERSIAFDHEFIGRAALESLAQRPRRSKVTLLWDPDDVAAIHRSQLEPGLPAKHLELPKSRYGVYQVDRVLGEDGGDVGISHDVGYITGERAFVSLASVDAAHAEPGTRVRVVWGEDPVSAKPAVEPHRQVEVRATVHPAPLSTFARESYRRN